MPPQPIFSNRLRHGSKPASPVAGQQALYAGSPKGDSGRGAPIAQGQSSDLNISQKSESRSDRDPLTTRQKLVLNVVQKTADKSAPNMLAPPRSDH